MKKIFTILSMVALSATAFAAQEGTTTTTAPRSASSEQRLLRRIIPQAQVITTAYQGSDNANYINKSGVGAGILADLGTGYNLVFETGALYREMSYGNNDLFGSTSTTNRYISIPADLKYYFSGQENSSLYLKAGAMGSTLASSDTTYSPGYNGSARNVNGRTWELSYLGGLGAKLRLSPASDFVLEAAYTRATDTINENANVYNAAWNFSAGLAVNL